MDAIFKALRQKVDEAFEKQNLTPDYNTIKEVVNAYLFGKAEAIKVLRDMTQKSPTLKPNQIHTMNDLILMGYKIEVPMEKMPLRMAKEAVEAIVMLEVIGHSAARE